MRFKTSVSHASGSTLLSLAVWISVATIAQCFPPLSAPAKRAFFLLWKSLESPGFAQNFGSWGEAESLHVIGVLTFDDEFREDVGLVGIQEKFRKALA
jgi:hypothetical protein